MNIKNKIKFKKILIILLLLIINKLYNFVFSILLTIKKRDSLNFKTSKFAILYRKCYQCGLFSFFITSLGCINKYYNKGYIPLISSKCFPNVLNGYKLHENLWEMFFGQPFGFTLDEVLRNAIHTEYIRCDIPSFFPSDDIFFNKNAINFWHNFAKKFMPIKNNLIKLSNKIMKKLFHNSKNILGVLIRGTDYITIKPSIHPVQPTVNMVISDIKKLEIENNYDYIYFTTEDENIRKIFKKIFANKIRELHNFFIDYNYSSYDYLNSNKNIYGNIKFNKQYLLNIIILSKCLDLLSSRCSGAVGIILLTNGFRFMKIYDLGRYK